MIDQIAQQVSEKTGLSEELAKVAVVTVVDQLKQRLPAPIASQIDSVLNGEDAGGGLADMAKGFFGN